MPLLLLLFVGSGCAALIYEIIWFQILQLSIGSTAVSFGVLLGTFMGGMCVGSLSFSRLVSRQNNPLRIYAWLELTIGLLGVALLYLLPLVAQFYTALAPSGSSSLWLRASLCVVGLLPPTVLMGATLPAIARWIEQTGRGNSYLGFFYGANIAGAVFGSLLAGFFLLRVFDVTVATFVAVAINVVVAAIGFAICDRHTPQEAAESEPTGIAAGQVPVAVYLAIGVSGMCSLGSEVIWTRALSLMLGATVYTFSLILAAFLVGLGIGSTIASLPSDQRHARFAFGMCQLALVPSIAWAAHCITTSLPYWPIDPTVAKSPWHMFQLDLLRCFWTMLPAACLWGASFPLAVSAAARGSDLSRVVGRVYAANTVGAIIGSVLFSLLAIQWLGTQNSHRVLLTATTATSVVLLWPSCKVWLQADAFRPVASVTGICTVIAIAGWLVSHTKPLPAELIGMGRTLAKDDDPKKYIYAGEGMNASVAVSDSLVGIRNFHVSGKIVASSGHTDMRLQRMLCHLPALMHTRCESVLIVGCGAGVTAGSFVIHPHVKRIVICEIEPLIPAAAGKYFAEHNYDVMNDTRVEVVYDDARHFIATTREKFDVITSDPIHPWVKGAAAIYSAEYYRLCQKRLNPGGVVTQWVPLYEASMAAAKSQVATFVESFPQSSVWGNLLDGDGYDVVMLGTQEPMTIDFNKIAARLTRPDHAAVAKSLTEIDLGSANALLGTYAGRGKDLRAWLADAQINRDRNMRLQYIAGLALNSYEANRIYQDMLRHRKFPSGLIVGNGETYERFRAQLSP